MSLPPDNEKRIEGARQFSERILGHLKTAHDFYENTFLPAVREEGPDVTPERLRELAPSAALALLVKESLMPRKKILAEKVFAERIEVAVRREEIQFRAGFPHDEPEELIAIRGAKFKGFEERGYALFLVVKDEWIEDTLKSKDRSERLESLYENLKMILQVIDGLRAKGDDVLTRAECKEIIRQARLLKEQGKSP